MNYPAQQPLIQPAKSDYERIADLLDQRITKRSGIGLVEFAETCVVTAGPKKGQILTLKDAPYARKPLQKMDPADPCQLCVLMWASQAMKSVQFLRTGFLNGHMLQKQKPVKNSEKYKMIRGRNENNIKFFRW